MKNHLGYSRVLIHYPVLYSAMHLNKAYFHLSDRLKKQEKLLIGMERRQHHDVQHNEIALKLLPCLPGEKMKYNKQEKSD